MLRVLAVISLLLVSLISNADETSQANKELVVQFFNEVFLQAQAEKIDDYIGDQYIQHNPNVPMERSL